MPQNFSKMRLFLLITALAFLFGTATTGNAQSATQSATDSKAIKYGDTVTGEISDAAQSVTYQFTGKAKDVAVVQFVPIVNKDYSSLSSPVFTLQNNKGRKIADSSKVFVSSINNGQAFVVQLPTDGTYTIGLARNTNSTTSGSFTLNLNVAPLLVTGKTVKGTISSKATGTLYGAIYAVDSADNFGLTYALDNADYTPSLRIDGVDDSGVIYTVGILGGDKILSGTLSIAGSKSLYVIAVGNVQQDVQDSSASAAEQKADYTLTLTAVPATK